MENNLVLLKNDQLTVVISPLGAELQSVKDAAGNERLWNGDPAFWTGRAPVLFPFAGGLNDDRFDYRGKSYTLPKHGFARRKMFKTEAASDETATFLLNDKVEQYPFDYELRLTYTLKGASIQVEYKVKDVGNDEMYASIGCHEAYMAPGGIDNYRLVFEKKENLMCHPLEGNAISHTPNQILFDENVLPLKEEYFAIDAMVFPVLNSRSVTLENSLNNLKIKVDFKDFDSLLIWKKPSSSFLAIEPWCNAPEFADAPFDLTKKKGFFRLEAGEEKVLTHTISFL